MVTQLVLLQPLPKAAWDKDDEDEDDATLARKGARSATDIARKRLDKLMKNPDKPVSNSFPPMADADEIFLGITLFLLSLL